MKKSILATLLAGLVTLGAVAGDEAHMMKLRVEKDDNGPTIINVEENGSEHVFEFTDEELKDDALIADRLSGLDEKTRVAVSKALKGIVGAERMVFIDEEEIGGEDGHQMVVVKEFKYDSDGTDDGKHVVIKIDGDNHADIKHRIVESIDGDGFEFNFATGDKKMKMRHGPKHAAKVIESLIKHGDLTPEQLDKLQQLLDEKRSN